MRKGVPWPHPSSVAGGLLFFVSLTGSVLNLRCRALLRNLTAHRAFQKGKVPDPADLFLVRLAFDELHLMYAANGRSLPILFMKHISAIPDTLNTKAPCFQGACARSKGKGYSAVRVARNRLSRLFRIAHSHSAILLLHLITLHTA
jgi:hypothetical protein